MGFCGDIIRDDPVEKIEMKSHSSHHLFRWFVLNEIPIVIERGIMGRSSSVFRVVHPHAAEFDGRIVRASARRL